MPDVVLPPPIAAYIAADKGLPGTSYTDGFAEDAVVVDERETHVGHAAILAWRNAAKEKYRHAVEPLRLEERDGEHVLTGRVSGDFPGSPADLRFAFTLRDGAIARLSIG